MLLWVIAMFPQQWREMSPVELHKFLVPGKQLAFRFHPRLLFSSEEYWEFKSGKSYEVSAISLV